MSKNQIKFEPNPLFYQMKDFCKEMKTKKFWIPALKEEDTLTPCIVNLGGTRSGKSWEAFNFIYWLCGGLTGLDIRVFRNTLDDCKQKTLKDFKECMQFIGVWDENSLKGSNEKPKYTINGNIITFMGIPDDENVEGFACDIAFFNEVLETENKNFVNGMIDRCRRLSILDSNPSKSQHFVFNFKYRDDVMMTHTTWRDNKHLKPSQIAKITKYAPYYDEDVEYKNNKLFYNGSPINKEHHPPIHIENTENKTIDYRRWMIYDHGVQASVDGVIFPNVEVSTKKPNIPYSYGIDLGFTNDPTSLTRCWEDKRNIYIELLIYEPFSNPDKLSARLSDLKIERNVSVISDSSDRYVTVGSEVRMVRDLRKRGWRNIKKVKKSKDIAYWVQSMNKKNIVIINSGQECPDWVSVKYGFKHMWEILLMEFDGYVWWRKGEVSMETPDPSCIEHAIDSARYRHMNLHQGMKLSFNKK